MNLPFTTEKPIIGVVNLRPLPGSPAHLSMIDVIDSALADARALVIGGIDGILVENTYDVPLRFEIGPETVASMTRTVERIVADVDVPVGVSVIMEPGDNAAIAIAVATGARFIRAVSFNEAVVTAAGIFEGQPIKLARYRKLLDAGSIAVLGDVHIKHCVPIAQRSIEDSVVDAIVGGANAVVVTGEATGVKPAMDIVARAKRAARGCPVFLGSGLTPDDAATLLEIADGAIVGSYFKAGGVYTNPVDAERVRGLVEMARGAPAVR